MGGRMYSGRLRFFNPIQMANQSRCDLYLDSNPLLRILFVVTLPLNVTE